MQIQPNKITDRNVWNATLAQMPYAHVLQAWEWGDFKHATTGWTPQRIAYMHKGAVVAMAQILTRRIGPFAVQYVPKGPARDYTDQNLRTSVIKALQHHARESKAIFIKIDPDVVCGTGVPGEPEALEIPLGHQIAAEWQVAGMHFSPDQVQFRNSVIVDLRPDEDTILS